MRRNIVGEGGKLVVARIFARNFAYIFARNFAYIFARIFAYIFAQTLAQNVKGA